MEKPNKGHALVGTRHCQRGVEVGGDPQCVDDRLGSRAGGGESELHGATSLVECRGVLLAEGARDEPTEEVADDNATDSAVGLTEGDQAAQTPGRGDNMRQAGFCLAACDSGELGGGAFIVPLDAGAFGNEPRGTGGRSFAGHTDVGEEKVSGEPQGPDRLEFQDRVGKWVARQRRAAGAVGELGQGFIRAKCERAGSMPWHCS